jgi:hypothetical protein
LHTQVAVAVELITVELPEQAVTAAAVRVQYQARHQLRGLQIVVVAAAVLDFHFLEAQQMVQTAVQV